MVQLLEMGEEMMLSNKVFDFLNKLQRWLPSVGIFYLALCKIWGFPFGMEVNETIVAIAALLAATLEISSVKYYNSLNGGGNDAP